jgi:hypothetical protein
VGERYEIGKLLAWGGMGIVHRAGRSGIRTTASRAVSMLPRRRPADFAEAGFRS